MEDFIDIHLNGQLELYLSRIINKNDYDIFLSDIIDDEFWNFAYLKNNNVDFKKVWKQIKNEMLDNNRKPLIYITSLINNKSKEELNKNNINLLYTDVWMTIDNLEKFKEYNSKIDFDIYKVDNDLKDKFVQAVMDGFSGDNPEEPYESLSEGYRVALEESFKESSNTEYKVLHYLGLKDNEAITTATVIYCKDKAVIYNITTNRKYQKMRSM
ncbi:MAG: hypothetical protein IJB90_03955 [Clostridia bacterium]|nr:hypothetical protein [Clostridia bacterium]